MQLKVVLGLLAILQVAASYEVKTYEVRGFCNKVISNHVRGIERNRAIFLPYENIIYESLKNTLSDEINGFFVEKFIIHDHSELQTVTYHGYIVVNQTRENILKQLENSKENVFFLLREIEFDSIPVESEELLGTSQAKVSHCYHSGALLPNGVCVCPKFYAGAACQDINCQHYGISDTGRCSCPPGVYGVACESKGCLPVVQDTIDDNEKSFMLVINQNTAQAYAINQFVTQFSSFLNPNITYVSYRLTHYIKSDAYSIIETFNVYNYTTFIEYVSSLNVLPLDNGSIHQPHFTAISQAHSQHEGLRGLSPMYVLANTGASDYINMHDSIARMTTWRTRMLFIYVTNTVTGDDLSDASHDSIRRLSHAVIGDVLYINRMEINTIMNAFAHEYTYNEVSAARYGIRNSDPVDITIDPNEGFLLLIGESGSMNDVKIVDDSSNVLNPTVNGSFFFYASPASLQNVKHIIVTSTAPYSYKKLHFDYRITALVTFSSDPDVDVGIQAMMSDIPNYATALQLGVTGQSVLSIYDLSTGETVTDSFVSTPRPSCSFNLLFDTSNFRCTPGALGVQITTPVNEYNHIRIIPSYCNQMSIAPLPSFICSNGGTLNSDGTKCTCTEHYTGDHCDQIICLNGGTVNLFPDSDNPCVCRHGYGGRYCEDLTCNGPSIENTDYSKKALAFVIQSSMSQASISSKIKTGISTMLLSIPKEDQFSEYLLTTFNNNTLGHYDLNNKAYQNQTDFKTAISEISYQASAASTQDSLSALLTTVLFSTPRSTVYLFVDSPAENVAELEYVVMETVELQIRLNIIVTAPFGIQGLCMSAGDREVFARIARLTGGIIMNLCNKYEANSQDPIVQLLSTAGSMHHQIQILQEKYSNSCSKRIDFSPSQYPAELYIYVNSDVTSEFTAEYADKTHPGTFIPLQPVAQIPFVGFYHLSLQNGTAAGFTLMVEPVSGAAECLIQISEVSKITATVGFSDNPSTDTLGRAQPYGISVSPVVHFNSIFQNEPVVQIKMFDEIDRDLFSALGKKRSGCTFEYFFDNVACKSPNTDTIFTIKIDIGDRIFTRVARGFCFITDGMCLNNGAYDDKTKTCSCKKHYEGKYCELPICENGGGGTTTNTCSCDGSVTNKPAYTGDFCEYLNCPKANYIQAALDNTMVYKQVTFLLDVNSAQTLTYLMLQYTVKDFLNKAWMLDNFQYQFTLITFTDTDVTNVISTTNPKLFLQKFNSLLSKYKQATNVGKTAMADALSNAYAITIDPPAILFVFTGDDSNSGTAKMSEFVSQSFGTQTNIFYIPTNSSQAYPKTFPMMSPVRFTGGRSFKMTPYDVQPLTDVLVSALNENGLVIDDGEPDCSNGYTFHFAVDQVASAVVLTFSGKGILPSNVTIMDSASFDISKSSGYKVLFNNDETLVISIAVTPGETTGGTWSAKIFAPTYCTIQVRVNSPIQIIPGFTEDPNDDFPKDYPFTPYGKNKASHVLFRVAGSQGVNQGVELTALDIYASDIYFPSAKAVETKTESVALEKRWKACAYGFVTPSINHTSTAYQKFIVYGIDNGGHEFQRTFPMSFMKTSDTTITCKYGTRDDSGMCTCNEQHVGETCINRVCQNGGISSFGICICLNSYYGPYCEQPYHPSTTTAAPTTSTSTVSTSTVSTATVSTATVSTATVSTAAVSTATVSTAAVSTSTVSAPASPTTKGTVTAVITDVPSVKCDPSAMNYYISFFTDGSFDSTSIENDGQETVITTLASKLSLGQQTMQFPTRFTFGVIADNFYGGIDLKMDSMTKDMETIINAIDAYSTYNVQTSIDMYVNDYFKDDGNANPQFAIIILDNAYELLLDDLKSSVQKLREKNIRVLGVDMGLQMNRFEGILENDNTFSETDPNNISAFIIGRICAYRPISTNEQKAVNFF